MISFEKIKTILKQRFPLIMVDRVLDMKKFSWIKTVKNVTGNEIYFLGHFPEYSIMPGVYIIEAMAQSASILFSSSNSRDTDSVENTSLMLLGNVNSVRFILPVLPGDRMIIEISVIKMVEDAAIVEGIVFVDEKIVAKGKLTFSLRKM
jgi:3-hydroxyacyl-[acyl-carrier-protein] dehydratase